MTKEDLTSKLQQYKSSHEGDWIGLHDTHEKGISEKIENTGLCVSYNPYGKKARRFINESGEFDLSNNFMTTMYHLSNDDKITLLSNPVEPIIVNIPKQILEMFRESELDEQSYQKVCMYGFQQPSTNFTDENGNLKVIRGDVLPQDQPIGANIRLLPACFVAGHFDMETGSFIENPKHFSKLPPEKQQLALNFFASIAKQRITPPSENE